MPDVSVIIPSYNHAAFIAEAVESVLGQTLADLELIVVDDGSIDQTLEVLAGYHDPRLQVYPQANQGAAAAINRGLGLAQGAFLAICDSDDRFAPTRLERLVGLLKTNPHIGLVGSSIQVIGRDGEKLGVKHGYRDLSPWTLEKAERSFRAAEDGRAALLAENYLATTSNFCLRRETFERVGPFRPLRYTHDWDFALRVTRSQEVYLAPEALLDYRLHGHNTIRENQAGMVYEICWILAVHLPQSTAKPWFKDGGTGPRTRQLLHSLYTYGMERVLNVMLMAGLAQDEQVALEWLGPDHPGRQECLAYIQEGLARSSASDLPLSTTDRLYFGLKRRLGRMRPGSKP
jgi:glycosyltransferase involved in cell wall biosynthesis